MPSAQNRLLLLTYDGTCYHGWQVQPDSPTIEDKLEQAVKSLTGESVKVHGAGRTDSGVHALNFTANFKSSAENFKTPEKWRIALNTVLPADIVVKYAQIVSPEFHARHSAIATGYSRAWETWRFWPGELQSARKQVDAMGLAGTGDDSRARPSRTSR